MARTSASVSSVPTLDDIDLVVEADGHFTVPTDWLLPHLDDEHEEFKKFVDRSPAPSTEIRPVTTPTPLYLYEHMKEENAVDNPRHLYIPNGAGELSEMMDELGIDVAIANNLGTTPIRNPRVAYGMVNAYNNWLVDHLSDFDSVYGNLLVSHHHEAEPMAKEIDRMAGHDSVVGIQFYGLMNPMPGDKKYDPIYEAAERHGLPISFHSATGPIMWPLQHHHAETYAEDHVFQHPYTHMANITSMIYNGVPERFPELQFVYQESGLGYIPYLMKRLDDAYYEMGYELPALSMAPSEYLKRNFSFCSQPLGHTAEDPAHIAWIVDLIGPENVLFSADIPHPDFDTPEELFDRVNRHFSLDELNQMMGGNAVDLFGLD